MSDEYRIVWGRVEKLDAFDGGERLQARLVPEEEGSSIFLELKSPPRELRDGIALGARVACRTKPKGAIRKAFWVDAVERREGHDRWVPVWKAPKAFVARIPAEQVQARTPPTTRQRPSREYSVEEQVGGSTLRRRRRIVEPETTSSEESTAPTTPPVQTGRTAPLGSPIEEDIVTGTLTRLERLADLRTVGTVMPKDDGPLVDLQLRRAPRGLLAALAQGALLDCVAVPHAKDPTLRFSARVLRVLLPDATGELKEAWRHDPTRGVTASSDAPTEPVERPEDHS